STSWWPPRSNTSIWRISSSHRSNSFMREALLRDLLKAATVTVERCRSSSLLLPTQDRDIHVPGIDIESVADTPGLLSRDQCRTGTKERVVDNIAAFGVVQDRTSHQLHRLLCTVA